MQRISGVFYKPEPTDAGVTITIKVPEKDAAKKKQILQAAAGMYGDLVSIIPAQAELPEDGINVLCQMRDYAKRLVEAAEMELSRRWKEMEGDQKEVVG